MSPLSFKSLMKLHDGRGEGTLDGPPPRLEAKRDAAEGTQEPAAGCMTS